MHHNGLSASRTILWSRYIHWTWYDAWDQVTVIIICIWITIHKYQIFSPRYSVMRNVYTGYRGTSEIEHGSCACTVDYPLAKARGLSLRSGAQTMHYLSHIIWGHFSSNLYHCRSVLETVWVWCLWRVDFRWRKWRTHIYVTCWKFLRSFGCKLGYVSYFILFCLLDGWWMMDGWLAILRPF